MTDEEYVFRKDVTDKKRTAHGAAHKNRTGKGAVRLPSDNLTRKEWNAMHGEVQTFNLKKPMTYVEYNKLPLDLQREYMTRLVEKCGLGAERIGKMFGVGAGIVRAELCKLDIPHARAGRLTKEQQEARAELLGESVVQLPPTEPTIDPPDESPAEVKESAFQIQRADIVLTATPAELANVLIMMAGKGRRTFSVAFW